MTRRLLIIAAIVLAAAAYGAEKPATSCIACHSSDMFDAAAKAKVQKFASDVHAQIGLSCHDCHGGNPDPKVAEDSMAAMDPKFKANPFVGKPQRGAIPEFCGKCHSKADFMKRFNPAARVDIVGEYWTSQHGKLLKAGDTNVATCVDCHSVHDIKAKGAADSPVYATHVAETCSRCHSDPKRMAAYKIPTDQYAKWRVSVHANDMFEKGDLTAPTCNDCHGNHGATPPGVESVSFVCGQCHMREAELFRKSRKHEQWQQHNEQYLVGGATCGSCHDDNRAKLNIAKFNECVTCHENHGIVRPSIASLGVLPDTPCAFCHEGTGPLADRVAEPAEKAMHFQQLRSQLLLKAKQLGLQGNDRFDWLVDQAQQLPTHVQISPKNKKPVPRPEFARLFEKFRIGKTYYTYHDPATNKDVKVAIRRCADCHASNDTGNATLNAYVESTRGLTSMIARAQRILLGAQRGGVEVRKVRSELDEAVNSEIELTAQVHTFNAPTYQAKQKEGLQHAEAALVAGQSALDDLAYRRKGLLVALGVVMVVLVALALKIRML
ncbi:MAG TPA: cytochrome c3 family protein [Thermoanaerobaculia bacterium]|nr:cytochrome c3 family protein [Thermoanaerobaculia bacterium]